MKKLVTLCLVTILILSNSCIAWASGSLICTPSTVNLGTYYLNMEFYDTFYISNSSVGNLTVTIEVGNNDLGLKVSSTKFRLYGNQTKEITITGHFPSYIGTFGTTLTVKDNFNNEQIIFITGYAKKNSSSVDTKLPAPENITFRYGYVSCKLSWDSVPKAKSYKVFFPYGASATTNTTYIEYDYRPQPDWLDRAAKDGRAKFTVVAIDKNGKHGYKSTYNYIFPKDGLPFIQ